MLFYFIRLFIWGLFKAVFSKDNTDGKKHFINNSNKVNLKPFLKWWNILFVTLCYMFKDIKSKAHWPTEGIELGSNIKNNFPFIIKLQKIKSPKLIFKISVYRTSRLILIIKILLSKTLKLKGKKKKKAKQLPKHIDQKTKTRKPHKNNLYRKVFSIT